jgi:integrin beta 3
MRDLKAIGEAIVSTVKTYLENATESLSKRADAHSRRIEELIDKTQEMEERIAAIPSGPQGDRGIAGDRGEKGEKGEAGRDGKDGRDGINGSPGDRGAAGDRGERGEPGSAGERGVAGDRGERGEPGPLGERGIDGKSVTFDDVRPIIEAAAASAQIEFERRAQDFIQRAIDRLPVPKDGKDGAPGRDGADGLGFDDLELGYDGERRFTLTASAGGQIKTQTIRLPVMIDRGVYEFKSAYEAGDFVTYGGDGWVARRDAAAGETPGNSDAWRLVVRKGRDGKR